MHFVEFHEMHRGKGGQQRNNRFLVSTNKELYKTQNNRTTLDFGCTHEAFTIPQHMSARHGHKIRTCRQDEKENKGNDSN